MRRTRQILMSLIVVLASWGPALSAQTASGEKSQPGVLQEQANPGDIKVKIVTPAGTDVYTRNLVSLDILVDPSGLVRMLHVIHISGTEKDTHTWYNFANIHLLSYQYYAITGKGKVRIKQIAGPAPSAEDKDAVPPLRYEEYR